MWSKNKLSEQYLVRQEIEISKLFGVSRAGRKFAKTNFEGAIAIAYIDKLLADGGVPPYQNELSYNRMDHAKRLYQITLKKLFVVLLKNEG